MSKTVASNVKVTSSWKRKTVLAWGVVVDSITGKCGPLGVYAEPEHRDHPEVSAYKVMALATKKEAVRWCAVNTIKRRADGFFWIPRPVKIKITISVIQKQDMRKKGEKNKS